MSHEFPLTFGCSRFFHSLWSVTNLADGDGLYLRVKPNGSKLWLFNFRAGSSTGAGAVQ
ncbi:Arm DNA-binding domain-containing protein [Aeromonas enteropelogenes]|uniref:Arm DNA-binding domain-containing protein n=1 Tax=Aeromonas enteropelogenes TaxID=29489 RepID=UPI002E187338